MKNGASVSSRTVDGWTALHSAVKWNNFECVALLIDDGADVNARTNSGQTPLHLASLNREGKQTLELLLLHPLIVTSVLNDVGETAKQLAERYGPFSYMFGHDDQIFNPFDSED